VIRARAGLVRARTALVNTARGLAKSYGGGLRGCNVPQHESGESGGAKSGTAKQHWSRCCGARVLSEQIRSTTNALRSWRRKAIAGGTAAADQGRGQLIALTFLADLGRSASFSQSRDVGCYLGLQPGRRNSGQSEPAKCTSARKAILSAHPAGARSEIFLSVWSGQRSATVGAETGRARRKNERSEP